MYLYQKKKTFFAKCKKELIEVVKGEIVNCGCDILSESFRGVYFKGEIEKIFELNYTSRFITRIYTPIITFKAKNKKDIYENVKKIKWEDFLNFEKTFSVKGSIIKSQIKNSHYAALCVKDGIADYFRDKYGKRPSVSKKNPDISLNIFIDKNVATLSLDTSLESLHKRGYKEESSKAPIQENLAAYILSLHPYRGYEKLLDPFCGSGTFLGEALMIACNIPPGYLRKKWGFFHLPEFSEKKWEKIKSKIESKIKSIEYGKIEGSDISKKEIEKARNNLSLLPNGEKIKLSVKDFRDREDFKGLIFTNPPYGLRLSNFHMASKTIKDFGDFLKKKCKGSTAYIYLGNRELIKKIGLKPTFKLPLKNGGLDGRVIKIEIY